MVYDFSWPHDLCINFIGALSKSLAFYNKCLTHYRIHENNTIGLSFSEKKAKKSFAEKKLIIRNNAKHDYAVASKLADTNDTCDEKNINMIIQRYEMLSTHSTNKLIHLLGNNVYKESTTIKERIVDIVTCLSKG